MSLMVLRLFETDATPFRQIVRTHAADHAVPSAHAAIHGSSSWNIDTCTIEMTGRPDGDTRGADWLH